MYVAIHTKRKIKGKLINKSAVNMDGYWYFGVDSSSPRNASPPIIMESSKRR
jgi:hypothetical protein